MAQTKLKTEQIENLVLADITDVTATITELNYIDGVTSAIQTQLNAKGDVSKVGTPVNNQIGVWTGDGTIEGDTGLTFDTVTNTIGMDGGSNFVFTGNGTNNFTAGGDGYGFDFNGSNGTSAGSSGGNIQLFCGNGNTTGVGGELGFYSGDGGVTGIGGPIQIVAGNGGATSGAGGLVNLKAGNATAGNSNGGSVYLTTGAKTGSGTNGKFKFNPFNGSFYGILDFDSIATSDKTFTFPNTTGTIALTSDITGTNSGTNTGDQSIFQTIAVSGQSNVVADTTTDTLTLVAGTNVTITTDAGTDSITINASAGGGMTWNEETTTSATMAVDNAYIANNAGLVTLTLPTTAAVGKVVKVVGKGAGLWRIAQNASEIIHFGNLDSTTGVGGYIEATHRRDAVELVCVVADTEWNVISSVGNITVV